MYATSCSFSEGRSALPNGRFVTAFSSMPCSVTWQVTSRDSRSCTLPVSAK